MQRPATSPRAGALALALLCAASGARPASGQVAFVLPPLPIDTFTLANGLRVVVSPDHSAPVVAVSMTYGVGSAREGPGQAGFAYFVEHLTFEATESLGPGEYERLVREAGGATGGATDYDRTALTEVLPADRLDLALWAQAERMSRLRVSEASVRAALAPIRAERGERIESQPYAAAQIAVDSLATDHAPYRHPPLGADVDLAGVTVEAAQAFHDRWYVPGNAVLTVVGDVTPADVRRSVESYLAPIPRGAPVPDPPPFPATPRTGGERRLETVEPLARAPLVWIAYAVPPAGHADAPALALLAALLGDGEDARLRRELVREDGVASEAVAFLRLRRGPGTLLLGALAPPGGDPARLEARIGDAVARLRDEGPTEGELARVRNHERVALATARTTAQGVAERLQRAVLHHGDPFAENEEAARLEAVTRDDVMRVARLYLTPANRAVVVARPPAGGD